MRISTADGRQTHLSYCANVHPGERLDHVWAALDAAGRVRGILGLERMGLGVWLGRSALTALEKEGGAARLSSELADRHLEVVTLNGFPYGNFHADVVKRAVYHPDWTTFERSAYTRSLAGVLAAVLPDDCSTGTISTVPLAHKNEIPGDPGDFLHRATLALCHLAADLASLRDRTGKQIRVCLEPEPGCLLETTGDAVAWWTEAVPRALATAQLRPEIARDHLGICFDACHQAVVFEDAIESLDTLAAAEVPIGKLQLSSALVITAPSSSASRAALADFAEQRFLHQVRARTASGELAGVDDIYPDLEGLDALPSNGPWRVHFHVPIHRDVVGQVRTTRPFLLAALAWLSAPGRTLPHLEVETYTWSVLPEAERPRDAAGLEAGIAAELDWARRELST